MNIKNYFRYLLLHLIGIVAFVAFMYGVAWGLLFVYSFLIDHFPVREKIILWGGIITWGYLFVNGLYFIDKKTKTLRRGINSRSDKQQ